MEVGYHHCKQTVVTKHFGISAYNLIMYTCSYRACITTVIKQCMEVGYHGDGLPWRWVTMEVGYHGGGLPWR